MLLALLVIDVNFFVFWLSYMLNLFQMFIISKQICIMQIRHIFIAIIIYSRGVHDEN